ncbi:hypothetical protein Dsin_027584 [Dipteronia sinensis]|uniref:Uncharacterized protein n=1 Tax=Dipteronia sinensis TaxID=43782 RepID=A0AAD9ZNR9_9ROSI|nr:hypothetical protein Dsin_027584 [Dipteronia sinensis]
MLELGDLWLVPFFFAAVTTLSANSSAATSSSKVYQIAERATKSFKCSTFS